MALDKVTTGVIADDAVTGTQIAPNAIEITDVAADVIPVKPHIQPGVLQPAVAGKLLDGTTSHGSNGSTAYGTAQADGHSYYYTDIKGSKPIKDPRIGAHFGSQRHKFSSLQLLEQETATHGKNVYSFDGRGWARGSAGNADWFVENGAHGVLLSVNSDATGAFYEVTGYFNDINFHQPTDTDRGHDIDLIVNGVESINSATIDDTTVGSPLYSRYVTASSLINVGSVLSASLGTTPKINTLKYLVGSSGQYVRLSGIELIAQDTTSTATKSQIQIPSQNVVSYGKKFTVSGTPHYNPFATKGDDSASTIPNNTTGDSVATGWTGSTSAYWDSSLDTATSLGLGAWESGGNFYRPVNGGRVIKWVDSSGNIKTSVNMMPPSAKAIGSHSGDATPTGATNWSTQYLPIFSSGTIDHSQAEVAKTFNWREFGNGSANGGTLSATFADASMLNTVDDITYVMDDGLTSLSGDDVYQTGSALGFDAQDDAYYLTFIGTGLTINGDMSSSSNAFNLCNNLPYGTHIAKVSRGASNGGTVVVIDGVTILTGQVGTWGSVREFTFHQPKMPPIPEDAVVIADYMLMADFVGQTVGTMGSVSKGVRVSSGSRDHFCDCTGGTAFGASFVPTSNSDGAGYIEHSATNSTTTSAKLPYFGTAALAVGYSAAGRFADTLTVDGTAVAATQTSTSAASISYPNTPITVPGVHSLQTFGASGQSFTYLETEVASPIHTSSHYQSFETPFLHELIGGDRNMEQTNLVVTPDGKTWDEVTRDVSYIGNITWSAGDLAARLTSSGGSIFTDYRGVGMTNPRDFYQKDFAIAYDRHICLRTGYYRFYMASMSSSAEQTGGNSQIYVSINGVDVHAGYLVDADHYTTTLIFEVDMKRGDYFQIYGYLRTSVWSNYQVIRVK